MPDSELFIIGPWKEDLSPEEGAQYLRTEHVSTVKRHEDVMRCRTSIAADPSEGAYDAVEQILFSSPEDRRKAFGSEWGEELRADLENFLDVEETLIVPAGDSRMH